MKNSLLHIIFKSVLLFFGVSCSNSTNTNTTSTENIDPSELEYGGESHPIVSTEYERFLLIKTTSLDYCKSSIIEYCELNVKEEDKHTTKNYNEHNLELCQRGLWIMVKFPEDFPFYEYHNLVGWVWGYEESPDIPTDALGFSIHKKDPDKSYYVELDQSNGYGDVVVGADKFGNSLYSYLPGAYIDGGNLRVTSEIEYSYSEAFSKLLSADIDLTSRDFAWEDFSVKLFF